MKEEYNVIPSSSTSKMEKKYEVPVEITDLPAAYGDTKIFLLPRDPWWCFAYWEISEDKIRELRGSYGESIMLSLRIYDVTNVDNFVGVNANKFFDIDINNFQIKSWYINLPEINRHWCVDLGIKLPDGRFIAISRSNIVLMPRFGISQLTDEQWGVLQREFEKLLELSGVNMVGKGSFDIAKLMRERWEELMMISQIPNLVSSGFVSSFARPVQEEIQKKDFFLKADTELIVYGETMPNAKLYINGDEYKLSADGRFSLRMHLIDGEKVIPIKAISSDGTMQRQIVFVVTRRSESK
ncbi:MAG: DUF4912 domain-containing protein [Endomicrobia bacterium]|nr:DUF4912 domain-containing protein [Endomicrobiia bacterium]